MTSRSTAVPKLTLTAGAGFMAAAVGAFPVAGFSSGIDVKLQPVAESSTDRDAVGRSNPDASQSSRARIVYPVSEKWDDARHKAEFRALVVKKASHPRAFTERDGRRLEVLQQMRRDSLPSAMSYEAFIRERDRRDEMTALTDALLAYERKYGSSENA